MLRLLYQGRLVFKARGLCASLNPRTKGLLGPVPRFKTKKKKTRRLIKKKKDQVQVVGCRSGGEVGESDRSNSWGSREDAGSVAGG